jgi:hypothetical protein
MLIKELKLNLPTFKLKDWDTAVESASGAMQNILTAQTEGVRLLKPIQEPMASTERIGWLNLWSKVFAALEAVTAALTQRSKLVLLLSQRTSFELMLQAHASFMEEFIQKENNSLKPLLSGDEEELKTLGSELIFRCRHVYAILGILNKEMLKSPPFGLDGQNGHHFVGVKC